MEKRGMSFIKGALTGALVMLLIVIAREQLLGKEIKIVDDETNRKLESVRSLIDNYYLWADDIDEDYMNEMLYVGYVAGLKEPYSAYYDAEETREFRESSAGEFGGIGANLLSDADTKLVEIVHVHEDSPAEEAGINVGDFIYKVDGEIVAGEDMSAVISKIKGEVGTQVDITVLRGELMEEVTVTATRRIIVSISIDYEMKEDNIGYIFISGFDEHTYEQFEEALAWLEEQGMESLIIDLRNNGGGNLSTVCHMLDLLLPEGIIVYTQDKEGQGDTFESTNERQFTKPLAVLTNGRSASASEIFAGAVQDYQLGTIIGTTTYGKGLVQRTFDLKDGTSVKLTISEYFTPNGRNIHGIGIVPDIEIEYEYNEADESADNQLEKAIEIIKAKMQ